VAAAVPSRKSFFAVSLFMIDTCFSCRVGWRIREPGATAKTYGEGTGSASRGSATPRGLVGKDLEGRSFCDQAPANSGWLQMSNCRQPAAGHWPLFQRIWLALSARARAESATESARRTPFAPGRADCPMILSRSRCVRACRSLACFLSVQATHRKRAVTRRIAVRMGASGGGLVRSGSGYNVPSRKNVIRHTGKERGAGSGELELASAPRLPMSCMTDRNPSITVWSRSLLPAPRSVSHVPALRMNCTKNFTVPA
jgi:hypothetical protein